MKIRPDKHFDIESSVLYVSAMIIEILFREGERKFNDLYAKTKRSVQDLTFENYILSLDLLYALGKLNYYKQSDMLGLVDCET